MMEDSGLTKEELEHDLMRVDSNSVAQLDFVLVGEDLEGEDSDENDILIWMDSADELDFPPSFSFLPLRKGDLIEVELVSMRESSDLAGDDSGLDEYLDLDPG